MAKYEKHVHGEFTEIVERIHQAVMDGSSSASFEDESEFQDGDYRCSVRVYERYSIMGSNRVSMTVLVAGGSGSYHVSVITSGGSEAVFWKVNTFGEEAFLDSILEELESL